MHSNYGRAAVAFTLWASGAVSAQGQAQFQIVGIVPGYEHCHITALSGDGLTAAGFCERTTGLVGVTWRAQTGLQPLQIPAGSTYVIGQAVNGDGSIVAGHKKNASGQSLLPTKWVNGVPTSLDNPMGNAEARALSSDGSIIAGLSYNGTTPQAARWTSSGMQPLGTLGGHSLGMAISANGSVIVGDAVVTGLGDRAYRWTAATGMVALSSPQFWLGTHASGTNAAGDVIVGWAEVGYAFRWTLSGGMENLGTIGGAARSLAVSADGETIVGLAQVFGPQVSGPHATLWTRATGMIDLNTYLPTLGVDLTGLTLTQCNAISADGKTIVGEAYHVLSPTQSRYESFIVTIPTPGSVMAVGVLAVTLRRRRRDSLN
jgi:uncharacterized membrane protein